MHLHQDIFTVSHVHNILEKGTSSFSKLQMQWKKLFFILVFQTTQKHFCLLEVAQLCPTLCDPKDCNLPGSSIHGIFQARIQEWVAISFSRTSSGSRDWTRVSHTVGRHFTIWATRKVFCLLGYSVSLLLKKWKCY